jgi:hypothetical protein
MKSENNKANHKNCQNQGLRSRFPKSKDMIIRVTIPCKNLSMIQQLDQKLRPFLAVILV